MVKKLAQKFMSQEDVSIIARPAVVTSQTIRVCLAVGPCERLSTTVVGAYLSL
jgi:hypothetical protein